MEGAEGSGGSREAILAHENIDEDDCSTDQTLDNMLVDDIECSHIMRDYCTMVMYKILKDDQDKMKLIFVIAELSTTGFQVQ